MRDLSIELLLHSERSPWRRFSGPPAEILCSESADSGGGGTAVRFPGELCSGAGDEIRFSYPGAHRPIRRGRERGIHGQEQGGQESYYGGF